MKFRVYRYNPDTDHKPHMVDYEIRALPGMMLREALLEIKRQDESFAFRHSCGEGVCGSDGMNVNGKNRLACITLVADLKEPVEVRPFPGRPVIRDLVVDMSQFYEQYRSVQPYLVRKDPLPEADVIRRTGVAQHPALIHDKQMGRRLRAVAIGDHLPLVEEHRSDLTLMRRELAPLVGFVSIRRRPPHHHSIPPRRTETGEDLIGPFGMRAVHRPEIEHYDSPALLGQAAHARFQVGQLEVRGRFPNAS